MRTLLLALALSVVGVFPAGAVATSAPLAPALPRLLPLSTAAPALMIAVDTVPDLTPAEQRELRRLERAEQRARRRAGDSAGAGAEMSDRNPMAVAALALGGGAVLLYLLTVATGFGGLALLALIAFILAIVFGSIGLKRARRSGLRHRGLALAGFITGIVGAGIYVLSLIVALVFLSTF